MNDYDCFIKQLYDVLSYSQEKEPNMRKTAKLFVEKLMSMEPKFSGGELVYKEVRIKLEPRRLFFRRPKMSVYTNKVYTWLPMFQKIRLRRHVMTLLYKRVTEE